ncbi:hypothetical protein [Mesorhizobium sp. 1B3]|uniref:hypothetical protein n=1 Tax=Mesorhizobium sp. 1B3 TaxID=3243599 RepID=UPI003D988286
MKSLIIPRRISCDGLFFGIVRQGGITLLIWIVVVFLGQFPGMFVISFGVAKVAIFRRAYRFEFPAFERFPFLFLDIGAAGCFSLCFRLSPLRISG